jgi:hypothetical protein
MGNKLKILRYLSVILVSFAVILMLSIPAATAIGLLVAKFDGANWYENGCIDGVVQSRLAEKSKTKIHADKIVSDVCFKNGAKLRKDGYLYK